MDKPYKELKELPEEKKAEEALKLATEMANKLKDNVNLSVYKKLENEQGRHYKMENPFM